MAKRICKILDDINPIDSHEFKSYHELIQFVDDRPGHDKRYALNSDKIYKKLFWKSSTKINIGLEKTFLWYLNNDKYFNSIKKKQILMRLGKV